MSSEKEISPAEYTAEISAGASERALVQALRDRDPKAFEELTRSYGPVLLALTRRLLRDDSEAYDCVQETFLSVFRSIDRFEGRARLGTWIRRIATNTALMRLRAKRARPEDTIDPQGPVYDSFAFRVGPTRANALTPDELLQKQETRRLVHDAINALPDPDRLVLSLRDIEGFSTAEAAELLELSEGAVKTRLHRARTRLRERLQPLFEENFQ